MKLKRLAILTLILASFVIVATYQNCAGTRTITANLTTSSATVTSQLQALQTSLGVSTASTSGASTSAAVQEFFTLFAEQNSSVYYAEAPGSMGTVDTVMPLNFINLGASAKPTSARAYYVISGNRGALLVTSVTSTAAAAAATTTGSTTPDTTTGSSTGTAATTTPTASTSTETVIIAFSDAGDGVFSDIDFQLPVTGSNGNPYTLTTNDVSDGDFNKTIQLTVETVETSGDPQTEGFLTLTQPD